MVMSLPNITMSYPCLTTSPAALRFRLRPQALMKRIMETASTAAPKRIICQSCSKPQRTCLCSRFKSPPLDNSVHVTILQHSLERNHPLNSTRIAKLGLKNVTVVDVSDVLSEVKFVIRMTGDCDVVDMCAPTLCENASLKMESDEVEFCAKVLGLGVDAVTGEMDLRMKRVDPYSLKNFDSCSDSEIDDSVHAPTVTVTMGSYGSKCSFELRLLPHVSSHGLNFDQMLDVPQVASAFANGFLVERMGSVEAHKQFKLSVPRGSILLFPSDNAVAVKDLVSNGIEVTNLIVLDGTWAKATRMYNENPWLKALPHLKLELDKSSLYGEVRTQPKDKCLSTIESIVYALKAVGASPVGLDGLLDVFESMVGDQRRCMHERLSNLLQV